MAYLVRSFRTYARIRSLTTGTFNRIFKDRIALRLSGANSVQFGFTSSANPTVLETFQTYRAQQTRVNASPAQNFHPISTAGTLVWGGRSRPPGFQPGQCLNHNRGRAALTAPRQIPLKGKALASVDARNGIAFRLKKTP